MHAPAQPDIPLILVPGGSEPAVAAALAQPARLSVLMESARRTYTPAGLSVAEYLSRSWARRTEGPYAAAVAAVDGVMGGQGAYLLNHSYEWGCTAGAIEDPTLGGVTLLRTLDWPFNGLGRALVVTRWVAGAGAYFSVTWPGFVGVLSGLAPGRFAASINQPPLPLPGWGRALGWCAARARVWRSRALPPSHLLRLAFDTCHNFAEAVELLRHTPICLPAIFTLTGSRTGEAIVIERTAQAAFVPAEPAAANHWASQSAPRGKPRNGSSMARRAMMCAVLTEGPDWSFGWLGKPILQSETRMAMMANAHSGTLRVQGFEKTGAVTSITEIR